MLRDIIETAVKSQPDMELVNREDEGDVEQAVQNQWVDVAIVGSGAPLCERVFLSRPRLKVLVVRVDGRAAEVFEFSGHSVVEPSPQNLLEAIRRALRNDGWVRTH